MKIILIFLLSTINLSDQTDYDKLMVDLINEYRKSNNRKPLLWSDELYEISKVQIKRTDSTLIRGNRFILKHDMRLLRRYNVKEVLAYIGSESKQIKNKNFFIKQKNDKDYEYFIKKYFKKLYKKTLIKVNVLKYSGHKGRYILDSIPKDIYSYNGVALYIDSIKNGKTYVRLDSGLLPIGKIKLNRSESLDDLTKQKLMIVKIIMMWHYSKLHKDIILSKNVKSISAKNIITNGNILLSVANLK